MGNNKYKKQKKLQMVQVLKTLDEFKAAKGQAGLTVIDFTATWCPPCQRIAPKYAELDGKYEGVTLLKLDVDENADGSQEAGIKCMPTFQFYKGGEKVYQMEGANFDGLVAKIEELK